MSFKLPTALRSVILFPGQGSQYVGMAKNLCNRAKSLYDVANQELGYDILKLSQEGPEQDLNMTVHSQPAVFVANLAAIENLADKSKGAIESCVATAGFSLGEFCSLVLAESIEFIEALRLIKLRAEITQKLANSVPSGMMTVIFGRDANIGLACKLASEYCIRSGVAESESVCSIANHLFPHGKVIGGHQHALDFIEHRKKEFGIKKTTRLAVSGAFHTALFKQAGVDLKQALTKISIKPPKIPVYSNVDAKIYSDPNEIRNLLAKHVYMPVKWEQIMHAIYDVKTDDGLPVTFECGPQNNMTTILSMINLNARKLAYNIEP